MIGEALELRRLLKNRKLSSDELRELQNRKLREVVRHAYSNVPYYHQLFNSVRLSPKDIRTVEDLNHIPITTKEDLRTAGLENTIAKGVDLSSCSSAVTTGSTGKPFTIYLTRRDLKTYLLVAFRALLSIGFRPLDRLAILGITRAQNKRVYQRFGFYRSLNIHPLLPIEEQVRHLTKMNPTIFWFYPTALRTLMYKIGGHLNELVQPRILITGAEVLDQVLKQRIRADLNIDIFNFYGAVEIGRIAAECPAHEGLHVNADHVILESLDGAQPAEYEQPGVVVITSLNNFTMPLIRYQLGDLCMFIEKKCSCGSYFPLIGSPIGREEDIIRFPSGRALSPRGLYSILRKFDGINQFRLIQEGYQHLVLQLVLNKGKPYGILSRLRSSILKYLGEQVRLEIQIVDHIPEEKLKFRAFISKLANSEL
jgi:phenylacetate-CoA ligase